MIQIPLTAGACEMTIEWLPVRPVDRLGVYVDGAAQPVALGADRAIARFRRPSPGWVQVAWACLPGRVPRDRRFLGLPVQRVSWTG